MTADAAPRPNRYPAAILWDMDGTLVDTEPYWIDGEFELVAEHGTTWSLEQAHALVGNPLPVSAGILRDTAGVDLAPDHIIDLLITGVIERTRARIPWRPGAGELLAAAAAAGVPCALVTMSYRSLADTVVEALPPGTFSAVVTGDEVTHGKPHPEPYLKAARLLGVDPAACVAIEDSPTGIASAEAAGVPTIGVPHVIELTAAPGRSRLASLADVTLADLGAIAAGQPRDDLAHHDLPRRDL